MDALAGIQLLQEGNVRLVPLEIFCGTIRAFVRNALIGKAEDIVGGYLECVGQADEQVRIRYGYAAFNPAQRCLCDSDLQGEGFLRIMLLHS